MTAVDEVTARRRRLRVQHAEREQPARIPAHGLVDGRPRADRRPRRRSRERAAHARARASPPSAGRYRPRPGRPHRCYSPTRASPTLLAAIGPPDRLRTARTPAFLRWRYGLAALGYRAIAVDDDPAAGLAIFRVRRRGAATEAGVSDLLVPLGAERARAPSPRPRRPRDAGRLRDTRRTAVTARRLPPAPAARPDPHVETAGRHGQSPGPLRLRLVARRRRAAVSEPLRSLAGAKRRTTSAARRVAKRPRAWIRTITTHRSTAAARDRARRAQARTSLTLAALAGRRERGSAWTQLETELAALPPAPPLAHTVSFVVIPLPGAAGDAHPAAGTRTDGVDVTVARPEPGETPTAAAARVAAATTGDLVCFCASSTGAIEAGWLARLATRARRCRGRRRSPGRAPVAFAPGSHSVRRAGALARPRSRRGVRRTASASTRRRHRARWSTPRLRSCRGRRLPACSSSGSPTTPRAGCPRSPTSTWPASSCAGGCARTAARSSPFRPRS